ncbi:MAG TPA: zf-HC2 domain-containing protein [Steroidobacteraceae bacterium]|nr:zf-HC2 domain-containing protein [Steroidobacteraceae bacterium]
MKCAESLRVQAYFDAEVDAVAAAEIERHTEHCAECRALLGDLAETRAALRSGLGERRAPPALRGRIARLLEHEAGPLAPRSALSARPVAGARSFWLGALGGAGVTAIAAAAAILWWAPAASERLPDELLAAHLRSLMPAHLTDVLSTDRHTVKPWFAGHADVSPVVADFTPQGYRLLGGRADYLERQRAAVVVYQHGAHVINVFAWGAGEAGSLPSTATRRGYRLACWRAADLDYCAVSDTGWDELLGLERLLRGE